MKKIIGLMITVMLLASSPVMASGMTANVTSTSKGADNNTIDIHVSGITATNGISQIDCDVWSAYNSQDDLKNYILSDDGSGKYNGSFNIADHYYDSGIYYVDVYGTDSGGDREYLGGCYALLEEQNNSWTEYSCNGNQIVGTNYAASLTSGLTMTPNIEANNTDTTLKSGYGFTLEVNSTTSISDGLEAEGRATPIQVFDAVFPEFNYKNGITNNGTLTAYNRLGVVDTQNTAADQTTSLMTLNENPFSTNNSPVHFTPLWYPDNTNYTVSLDAYDSWTPGGMLSTTLTAGTTIDGQVYSDWHIAPIQ